MQTPLNRLETGADLDERQAEELADGFFDGTLDEKGMKAALEALNAKGVAVDELVGFAHSMRQHTIPITPNVPTLDTCGTGGDGLRTFNISTAAAILVSACEVAVAKHGNRSVSSATGSADVLEALGVPTNLTPEKAADAIRTHGFAFLFAPAYHPAMKRVAPVRKALGVRTIFNMLGPLTNPARPRAQVIGAYSPEAQRKMAESAMRLGVRRALVLHADGMDEAGFNSTTVLDVESSRITPRKFDARTLGIDGNADGLVVADAMQSAEKVRTALSRLQSSESQITCLNAGLALVAAGKAPDLQTGLKSAQTAVKSGRASAKLTELSEASVA